VGGGGVWCLVPHPGDTIGWAEIACGVNEVWGRGGVIWQYGWALSCAALWARPDVRTGVCVAWIRLAGRRWWVCLTGVYVLGVVSGGVMQGVATFVAEGIGSRLRVVRGAGGWLNRHRSRMFVRWEAGFEPEARDQAWMLWRSSSLRCSPDVGRFLRDVMGRSCLVVECAFVRFFGFDRRVHHPHCAGGFCPDRPGGVRAGRSRYHGWWSRGSRGGCFNALGPGVGGGLRWPV